MTESKAAHVAHIDDSITIAAYTALRSAINPEDVKPMGNFPMPNESMRAFAERAGSARDWLTYTEQTAAKMYTACEALVMSRKSLDTKSPWRTQQRQAELVGRMNAYNAKMVDKTVEYLDAFMATWDFMRAEIVEKVQYHWAREPLSSAQWTVYDSMEFRKWLLLTSVFCQTTTLWNAPPHHLLVRRCLCVFWKPRTF